MPFTIGAVYEDALASLYPSCELLEQEPTMAPEQRQPAEDEAFCQQLKIFLDRKSRIAVSRLYP